MALTLYWDTDTNNVSEALTTNPQTPGVEAKRSELFPILIFPKRDQTLYLFDTGYYVKFVVKTLNVFEEDPPLASQVTNVLPTAGDPYVLDIDLDTAAIRTAMHVDDNPSNDLPSIACMAEILYSPDASDGSWIPSRTIVFTLTNRVSQDDDVPSPDAPGMNALFFSAVTDYIGGLSTDLDYIPTVARGVPQLATFVVAGVTQLFRLIAGTNATDPVNYTYIRPVDYNAMTNAKVWQNVGLVGTGGATFPTTIAHGGTFATTIAGAQTNLQIQPVNAALTSISGLTPTNDDFLQYKAGEWANRTVAQVLTDLAAAGTTFQPKDATLTAFAALTIAANSLTVGTGADAFSQVTFAANTFPARSSSGNVVAKVITDFALTYLDDTTAAATRTTLGLVIGTDVQAQSARLAIIAANSGILSVGGVAFVGYSFQGDGNALSNLNASEFGSGTVPSARGGAGTSNGLLKANGFGVVTAAVPGLDYLAPGSGAGISGETKTFTIVAVTASAVTNGTNLRTAYTAAKALTPNGAAISATNRSRVVVPPGVYDLATTPLGLDGESVDLVGLTGNPRDALLTSQVVASTSGTVVQTANDVQIHGVTIQNTGTVASPAFNGTDPSGYAPSSGLASAKLDNVIIQEGGNGAWSMRLAITYSGTFNDCVTGDYSFGAFGGTFSGSATDCQCGIGCFGNAGTCSGQVTRCVADDNSFGGGSGTFSGVAIDCISGATSFGDTTLTGQLYYCRMTSGTFNTVSGGGITRYCLNGSNVANNQG